MKYYTKTMTPNDHSLDFIHGMKKYSEYIINQLEKHFAILIEDSELRKKIGTNARETIEKGEFSLENQNQQTVTLTKNRGL